MARRLWAGPEPCQPAQSRSSCRARRIGAGPVVPAGRAPPGQLWALTGRPRSRYHPSMPEPIVQPSPVWPCDACSPGVPMLSRCKHWAAANRERRRLGEVYRERAGAAQESERRDIERRRSRPKRKTEPKRSRAYRLRVALRRRGGRCR